MVCRNFILPEFCKPCLFLCSIQFAQFIVLLHLIPKLGQAAYEANRVACHRKPKADSCRDFSKWVIRQIREHKWSLDACCGYAKLHHLFESP